MNRSHRIALRRAQDPAFLHDYFSGVGLDIGAGADPFSVYGRFFPGIQQLIAWNAELRDAVHMDGAPSHVFDFVHSDCLGRFSNPHQALARWLEIVKPGGYLVLTLPAHVAVPGESTFTLSRSRAAQPHEVNALDLVMDASAVASCERVCVLREPDENRQPGVTAATRETGAFAIEVVLRKHDVPELHALLSAIDTADSETAVLARCREALRLYPYRCDTYLCVNMAMLRWGCSRKLEGLWAASVRRLPHEHLPKLFHALMLIGLGKLNKGFKRREALFAGSVWQRRTSVPPPAYADWRGESLEGKSIVIWSEFGLGDEIFFFRFARIFSERNGAARVTVVCQTPLVELFRASGSGATICGVDDAQQLPPHDYWVYPHAIPAWAPLDIDHLPDVVPYLRADPAHPPMALPGNPHALKVGVVFKGAPTHENDAARSLPSLDCLAPLFALDGVEFHVMQKGQGEGEAADYAARLPNVHDLGPSIHSFGDTARMLNALDLLISVDTSTANLAGAMGRPVWLMLPMLCDWRWHLDREDSPWYPSVRLFRERGEGWSEVVLRMRAALVRRLAVRYIIGDAV